MFKAFEMFGVEVYKKDEWMFTKTFHTLKEAIEFTKHSSKSYSYKFISCDKYGNKVQEL